MPAVSEKQRRFFGAELGRARRGERTQTGLSENKLRHFARKTKGARGRQRRKTHRKRRHRLNRR